MAKPISEVYANLKRYNGQKIKVRAIPKLIGSSYQTLKSRGWIRQVEGGEWIIDLPNEPKGDLILPQKSKPKKPLQWQQQIRVGHIPVSDFHKEPDPRPWKATWKEYGPVVAGRQ